MSGAGTTKTPAAAVFWSGYKTARQSAPTLTPGLTHPTRHNRAEEG